MGIKCSSFKMFSWGIVAADKLEGSKFIEVYPLETLPFIEGEITSGVTTVTGQGVDTNGQQYTANVEVGMSLKAEWMGETNRRTSPNVMKGEQVKVYTLPGTEEYYWVATGRDDHLRRGELITYTWNASGHGPEVDIEITEENHYSLTIDTYRGLITFLTSQDNEEPFKYTLQLNANVGVLTFTDNVGNIIQLDSSKTKLTLMNKDKTFITLDKKDIEIYAPNNLDIEVGNDCRVLVGNNYTETIKGDLNRTIKGNDTRSTQGNYTYTVGGNLTQTVSGEYTVQTAANMTISIGGSYNVTIGGAWAVNAPGGIVFNTPRLYVTGQACAGAPC